jgi:large subunit ribosomal protein L14e
MITVGDVAMKIAGRDAGKLCVVVDIMDNHFVLVDGETRRRKCNVDHLELLGKKVKVSKNATSTEIVKELKALGLPAEEKKKGTKEKKAKVAQTSAKKTEEKKTTVKKAAKPKEKK